MNAKSILMIGAGLLCATVFLRASSSFGQGEGARVVRLAELEIDPVQLEEYKAALREEIAASIRVEPGVLTLYAVSVKDHPTQIRLFEVYASEAAYRAHLQSPHFTRYKARTAGMVKALKLIETEPLLLGTK